MPACPRCEVAIADYRWGALCQECYELWAEDSVLETPGEFAQRTRTSPILGMTRYREDEE